MIDVEAMGAARWKHPMPDVAEVRQLRDQRHRGLSDTEIYSFRVRVGHAPAWPPRQFDRALRDVLQIDDLQDWTLLLVADARRDADVSALDDGGAIGPWPRWEYGPDLAASIGAISS
jgi:hypothetical protein